MSATASTEPKTTKLACKQPWFQLDENSTTNEPVVTENTGEINIYCANLFLFKSITGAC